MEEKVGEVMRGGGGSWEGDEWGGGGRRLGR